MMLERMASTVTMAMGATETTRKQLIMTKQQ